MDFKLHNPLKNEIADILLSALSSLDITADKKEIYNQLGLPPKENMGEIAFPCFQYAKALKDSPANIANKIQEKIKKNNLVIEAKSFGPYLNFYINSVELAKMIDPQIIFNQNIIEQSEKTMIEYSQPNTHKELHVGHMRNLCLGDAIVKLYRYVGIETISTTFPGDVGTHVAKCLWYYKNINKELPPKNRKGAWLGQLYSKANLYLEEIKETEQFSEVKSEMTTILKQIEAGNGEYFELWKETRQWSVELMQNIYDWTGTKFDQWYWESDVDASSVKYIKSLYEQDKLTKDQGAIGMNLEDDKLGFCLLLKSDGTGLYATKDVELARKKFEDFNIEKNIYVVDNRQSLHFKQVFKVLEKLGHKQAKNCYHLQYEMVELPDGAMSSRKGNIVPLQELIDQMQDTITKTHLTKYSEQWTSEKVSNTSKIIAEGAIKFGMTKVDSNKKIVFNMDEWLKLDGESGPYIQYVHARINSILQKADYSFQINDFKKLDHELEKQILIKVIHFNDIIENCVKQNKTHFLTGHLYETSKLFNSFYAQCKVINSDDPELERSRLALCYLVKTSLNSGLALLGITAPDEM